jgi:hypothetical protein
MSRRAKPPRGDRSNGASFCWEVLADYPPEVREVALAARRPLNLAVPGAEETLDESARVIG